MHKDLIIRYLNNELSFEQAQELVNWVKLSKENEKLFITYKEIWHLSQTETISSKETNDNWRKFEQSINWDIDSYKRKQIAIPSYKLRTQLLRVAAAIILLLGVGILIRHYTSNLLQIGPMEMHELIALAGEKKTIELSDGTTVWLNSSSKLTYSDFKGVKERRVVLLGEAFFEVASNSRKPFIIETPDIEVQVVGTSLNVSSYANDDYVSATLVSGRIKVKDIHSDDIDFIILEPNQKIDLDKESRTIEIAYVDVNLYASWIDNKLLFNNSRFSDVVKRLERWYDIDITYDGQLFEEKRITAKFLNNESITEVLNVLRIPGDFSYKKENDLIQIIRE